MKLFDTFYQTASVDVVVLPVANVVNKKATLKGGFLNGGGGGIRTHGTRERSTVFKTAPINRSGTPPRSLDNYYSIC